MDKKLTGKTGLITGASKGLGKAMALALGAAGAKVALVSRDQAKLDAVAGEIRQAGGEAQVFVADVTREDQVAALEKDVTVAFGRLDILINNAGINVRKPITEFTLAEWSSVMDT